VSGPDYLDLRERATMFEDLVLLHNAMNNSITGDGPAEQVDAGIVSANFFEFLGSQPIMGRGFRDDDLLAAGDGGAPGPILISHGLWTRRYGADPNILGRTVHVRGVPREVIGVMPADFRLLMPEYDAGTPNSGALDVMDLWMPFPPAQIGAVSRSLGIFRVIGRLREGVTFRQAQEEMDAIAAGLRDEHRMHADRGMQIDLVPMHAEIVGEMKPVVLSLFGAVGFVLLVACANVANLILVRGAHRSREVAVRAALGANRGRLMRQLLTENAVLAVAGTALGLLLATASIDTIVAIAPPGVPMLDGIGIDGSALWFALGVAGLSIVLFGLIPAYRASQPDLNVQLNNGSRGIKGSGHRLRSGIAVAEVAISLVLLTGSGLMIRSFMQLQGARLGFEPASVLTVKVALPHGQYDDPTIRTNYWNSLRREALRVPGVERAGLVWPLPFAGVGGEVPYADNGGESADWGRYVASVSSASPGYFETMGSRLLDGRLFTETDVTNSEDIVIVDDIVAQRLFPGENAVGRVLWMQNRSGDETKQAFEIVGVVGHIRHQRVVGPDREMLYFPTTRNTQMALVVRTTGDPLMAVGGLRRMATVLDPDIPLFDARTLEGYIGDEIAPTRFTMTLASAFALVALALASVGLYAVISYSVAQRTAELGLRIALGAHHTSILRLVLRHGVTVAAAGIGIGLVASIAVTRAIRSLLVGVTPNDPVTFVGVSLLLAAVALLASYVPARRAARVDPLLALRSE
ncbi:MAG: ABC transporter permease, partial [Gemmatimonadetes bacterium]|nr:ABC transporter permease [Gemmatimonadota bacterium]